MAYLLDIYPRVCFRCRKPAKVVLRHWRNYDLGDYCTKCGNAALKEQKAKEARETSTA